MLMKVLQKISILTIALMLAIFIAVPAMAATIFVPDDYSTVGAAVTAAADGDTIRVTADTTETAQIVVNKSLTVIGEGRPVIKAGFQHRETVCDARAWWLVTSSGNLELENLVLDGDSGSGRQVHQAIRAHGPGRLNNCEIKNIKYVNMWALAFQPLSPTGQLQTMLSATSKEWECTFLAAVHHRRRRHQQPLLR